MTSLSHPPGLSPAASFAGAIRRFATALLALSLLSSALPADETPASPPAEPSGPMWDLAALSKAPATYPAEPLRADGMRGIFFDGLPYQGKPTRVFAWIGMPKLEPGKKAPGIVLVHGGGGTAFEQWVRIWTERGYAAIAIDACGAIPLHVLDPKKWQRHEAGGPPGWGGWDQIDQPREDQWTYHAVADAILAHSLLLSRPEVDPARTGLTGISWGGYLTCILAGVDSRFKFAAPVYGCGFTDEHGFAKKIEELGPDRGKRWMRWWDPSVYLPQAKIPMLWVTGSNDFAYTFNALQKSYRLPSAPRTLSIRLRMPHGHGVGEVPKEIYLFAESIVNQGVPLPRVKAQGRDGKLVWAQIDLKTSTAKAELEFTKDVGPWQERLWQTAPATISPDGKVTAELPDGAKVYYLNITDDRDCVVSAEHEIVDL